MEVIYDPVQEYECFIYWLARLPESFNMLVTGLEANPGVLNMDVMTKWLLHLER